jgi:hypothetical protein
MTGRKLYSWHYTMYYHEKHACHSDESHRTAYSRSPELKRRSTRHISDITTVASKFGNSAKVIVPKNWLGRRVIAFLHSEFVSKHQAMKENE